VIREVQLPPFKHLHDGILHIVLICGNNRIHNSLTVPEEYIASCLPRTELLGQVKETHQGKKHSAGIHVSGHKVQFNQCYWIGGEL